MDILVQNDQEDGMHAGEQIESHVAVMMSL